MTDADAHIEAKTFPFTRPQPDDAASTEGVEVVPLDEPSMEDYPAVDEFGAPPVKVVKIHEGVRDTRNR